MKTLGNILLLIILNSSICFGQTSYFQKINYSSNEEWPHDIIQTQDGGFLVAGHTKPLNNNNADGYIEKLNNDGELEWSKTYSSSNFYHESCNAVIESSNGFVLGLGSTDNIPTNGHIIRIDSLGNVLWSTSLYGFNIKEIISSANSSFIAVGLMRILTNNWFIGAVKVDSLGNIQWTRKYAHSTERFMLNSATKSDDNSFVLTALSYNWPMTYEQSLVLKINSITGDTLWSKKYIPNDNYFNTENKKILKANDGGYLTIGEGVPIGGGDVYSYIHRFDEDGNTLWVKKHIYTNISGTGSTFRITDACNTSDGYYFTGYIEGPWGASFDLFVTKFDNNGDIISSKRIGDYGSQQYPYITPINSGRFALAALTDGFGSGIDNFYVLKGDASGGSGCLSYDYNPFSNDTISISFQNITIEIDSNISTISPTLLVNTITPSDSILCSYCGLPQEICIVTVDSTSLKNIISWEKQSTGNIESYNIYRNILGTYTLIGNVPYDSLSHFIDTTNGIDPNTTSYRYKMTSIDTCGIESELSPFHETIHLTTSLGVNNDMNLVWDAYEGFPISYYRIYRDTAGQGNFHLLDSVSSNNFTYTDNNPALGIVNTYMIEVVPDYPCISTKAANYSQSRSNRPHSMGPPKPIIANVFTNTTTIFEGQSIDFFDQSYGDPTIWNWEFPGAIPSFSTDQDPTNIQYNTAGQYTVKLTAKTNVDSNKIVLPGYINVVVNNGQIPVADFIATYTSINVGQPIDFFDLSTNIPTFWNWQFPGSDQNSSTMKNPTNITYSQPGTYDVFLDCFNPNGNSNSTKANYITVLSSTNIEEIDVQSNLEIYPNPSNGSITLKSNFNEIIEINIYNQLGQLTFQERLNAYETKQINLLHSGIYSVQVLNSQLPKFYKIIVK